MSREFKPVRFFVLMALLAFLACGAVAFFTQRAAHGRTAEERGGYATGLLQGGAAAADAQLPRAWEMNEMAERVLKTEGKKNQPMVWKTAFEHGYEDGFRKTHPAR